ncbi:MAG: tRNA pseudouridine(38-40) synthase TruA [Gammaproteobacteria bacterium]
MRIALGVEYDGSCFHGWQVQEGVPSVQGALEQALAVVNDAPVTLHCAGRTDAGVHALGQVAHFDTLADRSPRSWVLGANVNLPPGVSVNWAMPVDDDFHARFGGRRRAYRYVILNRWTRPGLLNSRVSWERNPLDVDAMREAAPSLLGEHDFSAFRAAACQARNPVRTVHRLELRRQGDFVVMDVEANAFLHHMVRNIAGSLMAVGKGDRRREWIAEVLASRDRRRAGVTAPPGGLYFMWVRYEQRFAIPVRDESVSFL